jgi:hypothetical protein
MLLGRAMFRLRPPLVRVNGQVGTLRDYDATDLGGFALVEVGDRTGWFPAELVTLVETSGRGGGTSVKAVTR